MKCQLSRIVLSGLLATGLTLSSAAAFAQQDTATPAPDASAQQPMNGRMGRAPMDPDKAVAHMAKRYNLSSEQQTQIKPIIVGQQQQIQTLRGDQSLSREDKMAKMKSIRDDSNTKIQAVLNDSQKQKFAQDQQEREAHMHQRMGGGDAAAAPQQ
jgi:Spy/CpxP family protein refolding chaperone